LHPATIATIRWPAPEETPLRSIEHLAQAVNWLC
jgi:hypothetical protein